MPDGDRAQRPPLLLAGENTGNVSAALRVKPRLGSSSSFSSSTAPPDDAKRAVASHLRAPDISRKASATGRSERAPPSATRTTAGMDNNISDVSMRAKTVGTGSTSSSSTATRGGGTTLQKRIGDLVKRAQPHTIVQTYDKILRTIQLDPQLIVNGEALFPDAAGASSLQSGWKHRGRGGDSGASANVAAGFFDPVRGRFHYALGFQFSHVDPALSLSTTTDIAVGAAPSTSSTSACRPCLFTSLIQEGTSRQADRTSKRIRPATTSKAKLSIKAWHLVAETPPRVGLALYELPLCVAPKASGSSSIVALVWTRDHARLEVVALFAQLHVPELLANALILSPSRPSLVVPLCSTGNSGGDGDDDDSSSTGLRGFTMALTLRTLDRVIWEREWYQVDFSRPSKADRCGNATDNRVVTAQLLDEHVRCQRWWCVILAELHITHTFCLCSAVEPVNTAGCVPRSRAVR